MEKYTVAELEQQVKATRIIHVEQLRNYINKMAWLCRQVRQRDRKLKKGDPT